MHGNNGLRIHRESAPQNLCKCGSIDSNKFTEAPHNFVLCQHRQLVNSNRGHGN